MKKLVKLKNGAILLYQHNNQSKATAYRIGIFRGGSLDNNTGISHLFEHMMFKGCVRYNIDELNEIIKSNFVNLNAATGSDFMYITSYESHKKIKKALDLSAQLLIRSIFPEKELEKEKEVIKQEIIRANDNLYRSAYSNIMENAYNYPEIKSRTLGSVEKMMKLTSKDLFDYKKQNIIRENFFASVCSNLPCFVIKRYINKFFINRISSGNKVDFSSNDLTINGKSKLVVEECARNKTLIYFAIPCYGFEDLQKSYLLNCIKIYLNTFKGPIFNKFREQNQLSYFVDIKRYTYKHDGLLCFQIETSADKVNDCLKAVVDLIKETRMNGITENEAKRLVERREEADDRFVGHPMDYCGDMMFEYLDNRRFIKSRVYKKFKKHINANELNKVINDVFNVDTNKIFITVVGNVDKKKVLSLNKIKKMFES